MWLDNEEPFHTFYVIEFQWTSIVHWCSRLNRQQNWQTFISSNSNFSKLRGNKLFYSKKNKCSFTNQIKLVVIQFVPIEILMLQFRNLLCSSLYFRLENLTINLQHLNIDRRHNKPLLSPNLFLMNHKLWWNLNWLKFKKTNKIQFIFRKNK